MISIPKMREVTIVETRPRTAVPRKLRVPKKKPER
jgi:hypothetical protein